MTKEFILKHFPDEMEFWCGYNCGISHCGIVTNDRNKAFRVFDKLAEEFGDNVKKYLRNTNDLIIILNSGERYKWVKAQDNSRGNRLMSIIIDTDIDEEIFRKVIAPLTRCGKDKVQFIDEYLGE